MGRVNIDTSGWTDSARHYTQPNVSALRSTQNLGSPLNAIVTAESRVEIFTNILPILTAALGYILPTTTRALGDRAGSTLCTT